MFQLIASIEVIQKKIVKLTGQGGKEKEKDDSNNSAINPKIVLPWKHYFWSCGCTTHWERSFPNKITGYKDEANSSKYLGSCGKLVFP